jgi:hypothetical protein
VFQRNIVAVLLDSNKVIIMVCVGVSQDVSKSEALSNEVKPCAETGASSMV